MFPGPFTTRRGTGRAGWGYRGLRWQVVAGDAVVVSLAVPRQGSLLIATIPPQTQPNLLRQAMWAALTFLSWFAWFRLYFLAQFSVYVHIFSTKIGLGQGPPG